MLLIAAVALLDLTSLAQSRIFQPLPPVQLAEIGAETRSELARRLQPVLPTWISLQSRTY
jgi:hypothetical protein